MDTIMSVILMILNIVHVIVGLLLMAASMWYFLEIQNLVSLRNTNNYVLVNNGVTWPQAVPWIFVIVGLLVLFISCCGCAGAKKKTRGPLLMYVIFEIIVVMSAIGAVASTLVFANTATTKDFIESCMLDGINNMKYKPEIREYFSKIEISFHCCGANQPRDYIKEFGEFPLSCCDTPNGVCRINDFRANQRHGCIPVTGHYFSNFILGLCAGGALTAIVGVINILITFCILSSRKRHHTDTVSTKYSEAETLNVSAKKC